MKAPNPLQDSSLVPVLGRFIRLSYNHYLVWETTCCCCCVRKQSIHPSLIPSSNRPIPCVPTAGLAHCCYVSIPCWGKMPAA